MNRNLRLLAIGLIALLAVAALRFVGRGGGEQRGVPEEDPVEQADGRDAVDLQLEDEPALDEPTVAAEADAERLAVAVDAAASSDAPEPFRGRLLDRATDEPIPFVHLQAGASNGFNGFLILEPESQPRSDQAFTLVVGPDGRWHHPPGLDASVHELDVLNPRQGTHIRSIDVDDLEPDPVEGWIARVEIGPTFRFDPIGVVDWDMDEWEARLVEVWADGKHSEGSWVRIHPGTAAGGGGPPWIRYDNDWRPNRKDSRFRIDLREVGGGRMGSSDLLDPPARGIHPTVAPILLDGLQVRLVGRVLDSEGEPKSRATVIAAPLGADLDGGPARRPLQARTEGDGTFEIHGLEAGAVQLTVRPRRGEPPISRVVTLDAKKVDVGDLIVARQVGVGMVRGVLRSASGKALAEPEYVRLRSLDERGIELFDVSSRGGGWGRGGPSDGGGSGLVIRGEDDHVFEFNQVPEGAFELSVVAQDGYRWSPERVRVTAPNDEVVFVRQDDTEIVAYAFHVVDKDSDRERISYTASVSFDGGLTQEVVGELSFLHWTVERASPMWIRAFRVPAGSPFTWTVSANGMRAAHGTEADFLHEVREEVAYDQKSVPMANRPGLLPRWIEHGPTTTFVARVELEPGFGVRLRLRDLGHGFGHDDRHGLIRAEEAPPLAGVKVRADGVVVATTDAAGEAWLDLDAEPDRITFDAPGWRLVENDDFRAGRVIGAASDVVIWMVRD